MFAQVRRRFQTLPSMIYDGALALVLMVTAVLTAYQGDGRLGALQWVTILLITLPTAARGRLPATVVAIVGAGLMLNLVLGFTNSFIENLALLFALYSLFASPAHDGGRLIGVSGVLVVGVIAGVLLGWRNQHQVFLSDIGYNGIIFALPVILGYGVRARRAYVGQLALQSELLARQAAVDERTTIARELHDLIAHSVSVMVLQATAGGRLARRDPIAATSTFGVIEQTGREALADLRRVIGVLKADSPAAAARTPQPGLLQLEGLVQQVRNAGINVDLSIAGPQRVLAPGLELSVYRIVQESLTNVMRHSGASEAIVTICYGVDDLAIDIVDNGEVNTASIGDGNGLIGMRERVALLQGEFLATNTQHGFKVSARIPLELC